MGETQRFVSRARSEETGARTALTEPATRRRPSSPSGHQGTHRTAVESSEELVLGRYRLRRRLGTGGFGTVWLARDERLERDVAIKMLARERIMGGRFEREARATARLNHPGIVTLYEAAVDDDGAYLVSELVRGKTLARLLEAGRMSDRDVALAAVALCDALQYAHDQDVVHRDVKPSNVLVPDRPHTTSDLAKLTDFGVAHVIGGDSLTRTGDVLGTTAYMAPEQAEGREVQPAADLYSLAVVLYEALTGINPLPHSDVGVRGGRLGAHLPPLRRHRRDLPRELGYGVDLALRPRARERGTIAELRGALERSLEQLEDRPGVVVAPWPSWTRSEGGGRAAGGALAGQGGLAGADRGPPEAGPRRKLLGERAGTPEAPRPGRFERTVAAIAAAAATGWFTTAVVAPPAALPAVAVLAAGLLVAALPRIGTVALVGTGVLLLILQDSPGGAVLLALAVLPAVLLLLTRPTRWPLPVLAPALGLLGLAGAWPGLAGRAASAWERLVLGAAGWVWLVVGELLTGSAPYVTLPAATPPPRLWMGSLYDTYHQVLHSLLFSGLLAPAVVWGLGAALLPRARSRAETAALAVVWGLGVAGLSDLVLAVLPTGASLRPLPTVLGGLACGAVAGAAELLRRRPSARGSNPGAGLA
jgi:hypothetical protein